MLQKMRQIARNDRGNAMFVVAMAMPVMIGAGGLATDTIQWTLWNRQLQRQADSAALAGAYAKAQGGNVATSANTEISRYNLVTLTATPVIENAPTTGAYAGNTNAVRVVLETSQSLPFSSFFLSSPPVIKVEATAAVVQGGAYCMDALDPSTSVGITFKGSTDVDMKCGVITNSKASNAVTAEGSSKVKATPVAAVGGLQPSNNYVSPTTLQPYSIPLSDPFADLPTPVVPNSCNNKETVQPQVTKTLSPGCYKGMDLKGNVTLNPGIYIIDGSSFGVGAQATVTGAGVTIILTSKTASTSPNTIATVDINGGADIDLTAQTEAQDTTYAGVLFYQDRRAQDTGANKINGNATSMLQGAIYMPSQEVQFTGTSGMNTNCLQIVSFRIVFSGNSGVTNECPAGSGAASFTGTRVQLVG